MYNFILYIINRNVLNSVRSIIKLHIFHNKYVTIKYMFIDYRRDEYVRIKKSKEKL